MIPVTIKSRQQFKDNGLSKWYMSTVFMTTVVSGLQPLGKSARALYPQSFQRPQAHYFKTYQGLLFRHIAA